MMKKLSKFPLYPFKICYKQRPDTIIEVLCKSQNETPIYQGENTNSIIPELRGKVWTSLKEAIESIPTAIYDFKEIYFLNSRGKMTDTTMEYALKYLLPSSTTLTTPSSLLLPPSTSPLPPSTSPLPTPPPPPPLSVNHTTEVKSVFSTIKTLHEQSVPDQEILKKVNDYDKLLVHKSWIDRDSLDETKWNPIASYYLLFYYIHHQLKWPLNQSYVMANYYDNNVKWQKVMHSVYRNCGIEDKLKESDIITQLTVWCIVSMNTWGLVRPMIFEGSTEHALRITVMMYLKQRFDGILYYITWPFRCDSNQLYILHDGKKIKQFSIKEILLSDFHASRGAFKKILKSVPSWLYHIYK
jgi:hypothetical protein